MTSKPTAALVGAASLAALAAGVVLVVRRRRSAESEGNKFVATGADTLVSALEHARDAGFDHDVVANEDGTLRCTTCNATVDAAEIEVVHEQRLEGASDAADMLMVVAANCPRCGAGTALVLGYGPNASEADAEVLTRLRLSSATLPPQPNS